MQRTENWRIRRAPDSEFFFVEADLPNAVENGHYPRVEVMQEDYGDHNGYTKEIREADAELIVDAPKLLEALHTCYRCLRTYGSHPIIDKQVEHLLNKHL